MTNTEPQIHEVTLMLCDLCLDGKGGECHTPGCVLWINRAPDLPVRNHPCLLSIDGKPKSNGYGEATKPGKHTTRVCDDGKVIIKVTGKKPVRFPSRFAAITELVEMWQNALGNG